MCQQWDLQILASVPEWLIYWVVVRWKVPSRSGEVHCSKTSFPAPLDLPNCRADIANRDLHGTYKTLRRCRHVVHHPTIPDVLTDRSKFSRNMNWANSACAT